MIWNFDSDRHACNLTIEIDYDIEDGERYEWEGHRYKHPAQIIIQDVLVELIEGYDADGNVAYERNRFSIDEDWGKDLDRAAFQWVQDDIDDGGPIGDAIWEENNG